ncbi:hypothetical protein PybrP1_010419 [[Pythium] brassicae (nom. inval.)]|nr:hypothetical protein PybrP1_010419 [[Pythium] brassicae (nom. inval.)]
MRSPPPMTANLYDTSERAGNVNFPTPAPAPLTSAAPPSPAPAPRVQPVADRSNHNRTRPESEGEGAIGFRVRRASGAAGGFQPANLQQYSARSCWQSFSRAKESVVLELDDKSLLSEIRILNKNACAVDVSLAVEDRPRSYVTVKRMQTMAHSREVGVKIGFIPCRFVRLEFSRHSHASIAVHGVMLLGVRCSEIEDGSGPSLCNLLSHATENLLFGSSLHASQPFMDFLSDHRSGSPEWMQQHRTHLLDEKLARLEAALFM